MRLDEPVDEESGFEQVQCGKIRGYITRTTEDMANDVVRNTATYRIFELFKDGRFVEWDKAKADSVASAHWQRCLESKV